MAGANNFQVFNEDYTNIMSDVDYAASTTRQEGVVSGPAVSTLHNKMYRQATVMIAALAAAMAAKEIDMLDSSLANLILSLGNLQIESEVDAKIEALGISAYIATLLNDVDAASARATLGVRFGEWETKTANTVYQAALDGFVFCVATEVSGIDMDVYIKTDGVNPPATKRSQNDVGTSTSSSFVFSVVRKNDYWQVGTLGSGSPNVYFIGIGS